MYKFKTEPYSQQWEAFNKTAGFRYAALLMEQGTGKTKVAIDRAVYNFERGKIDGFLVICPKSLIDTWIEEIMTHCPERVNPIVGVWDASLRKATVEQLELVLYNQDKHRLPILIANIEGVRTKKANKMIHWWLSRNRIMADVDESSKIKTPSSQQSQYAHGIGDRSTARTILTGTPFSNSPADGFSQLRFLTPRPLGFDNFYSFRARYCVLEQKQIPLPGGVWVRNKETGKKEWSKNRKITQIVGEQRSDELKKRLLAFSYFCKKDECLDLPPKIYHQRICELTKDGLRIYKDICRQIITEIEEGRHITVEVALAKLVRLQQVIGGFLPSDDDPNAAPIPGKNPKIELLGETIEEFPGPSLIWARFKPEHKAIRRLLEAIVKPNQIGEITGEVKKNEREINRRAFQSGDLQYLICTQSCAGYGYTLTAAENEFYYSNTFSHEHREQSEDRAHRIGLEHKVNIIDLWCPVPSAKIDVDMKLKAALKAKKDMAAMLTDVRDLL